MTTFPDRAFFHHQPSATATVRLVCFPAAGSSANAFRDWGARLPDHAELAPVQLPGRANRFRDPLRHSAAEHVDEIVEALDGLRPLPLVVFGNSMGAILAYELARRLEAAGKPPRHLWVCGHAAPHCPRRFEDTHHLDDEAFTAKLRELEGTPPEILQNEEMLSLVLPMLKADFAVFETYPRRERNPLSCPVTALAGRDDPLVTEGELEAWRATTRATFEAERLEGDHFVVESRSDDVIERLVRTLARP